MKNSHPMPVQSSSGQSGLPTAAFPKVTPICASVDSRSQTTHRHFFGEPSASIPKSFAFLTNASRDGASLCAYGTHIHLRPSLLYRVGIVILPVLVAVH